MPIFFEPRKKAKAVIATLVIILIVLLNNFSSREGYADLDRTMSSIYKDRLMPSGYLFHISNHLYQKRILQQSAQFPVSAVQLQIANHNKAIDSLIRNYDMTYLTLTEQKQWKNFKQQLSIYNEEETKALAAATSAEAYQTNDKKLNETFDKAVASVISLNEIQTSEGSVLQRHSKSVIGDTLLHSYMEIPLLFIVCVIIILLSGFTDKYTNTITEKHLMN
jgi:hypothetical protein